MTQKEVDLLFREEFHGKSEQEIDIILSEPVESDPLHSANCQECMEPECESCMLAFRRHEHSSKLIVDALIEGVRR